MRLICSRPSSKRRWGGDRLKKALETRQRRAPRRRHVLARGAERRFELRDRALVAGGEYLRNMQDAKLCADQTARWVEVCYCPTPLQEERPYWEQYFDLTRVQDAHDRRKCRDENGSEPWACGDCDCTARLEEKLKASGTPLLNDLRNKTCSGKIRQR